MDCQQEEKEELLRETEWVRVYRTGSAGERWESKFEADGLQVSAESIKQRWGNLELMERAEFANAFIKKPTLTDEDEQILRFLMQVGTEPVLSMIAYVLPRSSDRETALSFLLRPPDSGRHGWASVRYDVVATIEDPRVVPALRQHYEAYRKALAPIDERTNADLSNYFACLDTLWRLDGAEEYRNALHDLLTHPDEDVRGYAQFRISENSLQDLLPPRGPGARPKANEPAALLKETEWSKVYCRDTGICWRISKFRADGLRVSAASINERWSGWTIQERIEFAEGFCQTPEFTTEDFPILQLLVEQETEYVRTVAVIHLQHRSDRESVLSFLRGKLETTQAPLARYYYFLRWMNDIDAVPPLLQHYKRYRASVSSAQLREMQEWRDYFHCAHALWALDPSPQYQQELEEILQHTEGSVRREGLRILSRIKSACGL